MPAQIVHQLIAKVDQLTAQVAALQADMGWLKEAHSRAGQPSTADVDLSWIKKGLYLVGGAALTFIANYALKMVG